jgi:hypothetical protein
MTTEVTCPTCGTVTQLDDVNREAKAFCKVCDYPLFWIRSAGTGEGEGGATGDGLRRLPGTAGLVTVATVSCWNCDERNPINAIYCIRCGLNLHPAPPVYEPPPPPPEALPAPTTEPIPVKKPLIPPEWVPALIVATILLLWCLVGLGWLIFR